MTFHYDFIDHVQLAASMSSEDMTQQFYAGTLGVIKLEKRKTKGWSLIPGRTVVIHIGVEEGFSVAEKAHPAIRVKSIEKLKEQQKSVSNINQMTNYLGQSILFN